MPNLLSLSGYHVLHLTYAFASTIRAFRDCNSLLLNGSAWAEGLQPQTGSSHFPASRNKKESSASVVMCFFSCMLLYFRFVLLLAIASLGVSCVV